MRVGDRWIEGLSGLPGEMVTGTGARGSRYGLERGSSHTASARVTWLLVFVLELQMQCNGGIIDVVLVGGDGVW